MNQTRLFAAALLGIFCSISAFAKGDPPISNAEASEEYTKRSSHCSHLTVNSSCDQKPHVVFLVHGLTGKEATFHDLHRAIIKQYGRQKNIHVVSVDYPTHPKQHSFLQLDKKNPVQEAYMKEVEDKVSRYHPLHFAKIMNTKIIDYLYDTEVSDTRDCRRAFEQSSPQYEACYNNRVSLDTEYTLIVHSQGGLASMVYLNTCLNPKYQDKCKFSKGISTYRYLFFTKDMDKIKPGLADEVNASLEQLTEHTFRPPEDLPELDKKGARFAYNAINMVSLGSPFWGSPTANKSIEFEILLEAINSVMALPKRQLLQLAIGSRGLSWQRNNMLNRKLMDENGVWTNHYHPKFRSFNVAGIIQRDGFGDKLFGLGDFFIDWFIDSEYHENDIIVAAPEARLDFIYYLENGDNPNLAPYRGRTYATESYHPFDMSHVPIISDIDGMTVFIMSNEQYRSNKAFNVVQLALDSTFNPEFDLKSAKEKIRDKYVGVLSNFTSEIKFVTPHGYHRPISIVEDEIKITPQESNVFKTLKLDNTTYVKNHSQNNYSEKIKYHYWQTYYHIGKFNLDWSFYPRSQDIDEHFARENGGHRLNYSFAPLGFERKDFYNLVMPTFTSYAEVYLKPFQPMAPASVLSDGELVIGRLTQASGKIREFRLNRELKLISKEVALTSSNQAECLIGIVGQMTPDRFKHTQTAGMSFDDWKKNKRTSIVYFDRSSSLSGEVLTAEWNGNTYPVGPYLWNKYARNQNKLFSYVNQKNFDENQPNLDPYRTPTGTVVEVIGRFQQGPVDSFSGVGRACTPAEKNAQQAGCDIPSLDRYLVTSPQIRKADNIESLNEVGNPSPTGRLLGLRWMNVVDVDMLKSTEKIPVVEALGTKKAFRTGNQCLKAKDEYRYQKPGSVAGYFYRDIESRKLNQKVFEGLLFNQDVGDLVEEIKQ